MLHNNIFTKSQTIYKSPNIILATFTKKTQFYFATFTKKTNIILATSTKSPILFGNYLQKAQYFFGNYLQKPNTILATIYKRLNISLATFYQNPKTIGQTIILPKPKYYLTKELYYAQSPKLSFGKTLFDILNSLTHGKHKITYDILPIFQNNFFYKIHGNYAYFFHKKL